ncbi:MAG: cytochrome c peroxidase [Sedimenticolaceae bacterium]
MRLTLIAGALLAASAGGGPLGAETLDPEQQLGQMLYMDTNLSLHRNQSCNSCHAIQPVTPQGQSTPFSAPGFVDPDNVREGSAVSKGSIPGAIGKLNTPSAAYARFSPHFHWDAGEGLFIGGQFWNGRAATLAEQAMGPPLNPLEMAMPSRWAVVTRLKENPVYVQQFRELYRIDLDAIEGREEATDEQLPPPGVQEAYEHMARAIGEFEKSRLFSPFTSKFDFVVAGITEFTEQESLGMELFNDDRSKCSACHPTEPGKAPGGGILPTLFTDFSYDNLGMPRNVNIAGNPEPDPGLGGRPEIAKLDPKGEELGKHKVMGLRNIALTAPYMHNGVLATLKDVVHFYNTRDDKPRVCTDTNDPGFGRECWPAPEIAQNMNTEELGKLGLSEEEELALVAFMQTLSDGYPESGDDPKVPPGTPSPFAGIALPPAP